MRLFTARTLKKKSERIYGERAYFALTLHLATVFTQIKLNEMRERKKTHRIKIISELVAVYVFLYAESLRASEPECARTITTIHRSIAWNKWQNGTHTHTKNILE